MEQGLRAGVIRLGLISGFYTNADVINWAEENIDSSSGNCELELFEIAANKESTLSGLSAQLNMLSENIDENMLLKNLFKEFLISASKSSENAIKVANSLFNLCSVIENGSPEYTSFKDAFDDAQEGIYGDIDSVQIQLLDFLKNHSS